MKNIITGKNFWISVLLMALLSSCFEFREKVTLYKDGSGHFAFEIDMSELKPLLEASQTFGKEEGSDGDRPEEDEDVFKSMQKGFEDAAKQLASLKGISNVQVDADEATYVTILSYDFTDVGALNKAMNLWLSSQSDGGLAEEKIYFTLDKKSFTRSAEFEVVNSMVEGMKEEGGDEMEGIQSFFSEVNYSTEYVFERTVKKVSNRQADISADKRTVSFRHYPFREGAANVPLSNKISF